MKLKIILVVAVLVLAGIAGWQIGSSELANMQLQEDMRDLASQAGARIGLSQQGTEEDLRNAVIRKARDRDIELDPSQVTVNITVERSSNGDHSTIYLAADYTVPVSLPGYSFNVHFTPSSDKRTF